MGCVTIHRLRTRKGFRVNTKLRRQLAARKRQIERRLDKTKFPKQSGPVLAGGNLHYEMAERCHALGFGGVSLFHKLARDIGLIDAIDARLSILKIHLPYHESDHVINLALNTLCNGDCLQDIELRRNDEAFLDALGARRIPDPTTAADFCRRFTAERRPYRLVVSLTSADPERRRQLLPVENVHPLGELRAAVREERWQNGSLLSAAGKDEREAARR